MTTSQDIIKEYQRVSKLLMSIEDDIDNNRAAHLTAMEKALLESHKDILRYYMKMLQKRSNEAKVREEADFEIDESTTLGLNGRHESQYMNGW